MTNTDLSPPAKLTVALTRNGAVGLVRFSRPPMNFFSTSLIKAIADELERADEDPSIHATVLCSDGRNFCAGADLVAGDEDPHQLYAQALRIFRARKPMVAAVQGSAIGGGLGLAMACDFRVVSAASRLSANFVKLGIHPGFALTHTLPAAVGRQYAADLLLTGRRIGGDEAYQRGLADRLTRDDAVLETAVDFAQDIAENAPLAVEASRATLRRDLLAQITAQTEIEAREQIRLSDTQDFQEGVRAVNERRKGNWIRA